MKAIIPVAGFGTRFLPATKTQPKEMLPLVDTPVIQYIVEEIVDSGVNNIIFVTSKHKKGLEDYFDSHNELEETLQKKGKLGALNALRRLERMARFSFVRQTRPLGNGDAVMAAAHLLSPDEPFVLAFGDDIFFGQKPLTKRLVELYEKYKAPVCVVKRVRKKEVSNYGMIRGVKVDKGTYRITDIMEKPSLKNAPSNLAVFGRYVLTPEVLAYMKKLYPPKRGREVGVTDAVKLYLHSGGEFYAYEIPPEDHFDCGSKINFLKATVYFGLRHKELKNEFRAYLRNLKL